MLQLYGKIIADQIDNGFIEKVRYVANTQTRVHYIPHHPVPKQFSTTPIRIAYDCSCRQSRDHASDLILELIPDLSADTFIQAFRRFCSRKSVAEIIISDNATTFNTASKHIKAMQMVTEVHNCLNIRGVDWKFIPKRAPWYGGWWERLIGLTKETLKKVLGRSYVYFQTLCTAVTEI